MKAFLAVILLIVASQASYANSDLCNESCSAECVYQAKQTLGQCGDVGFRDPTVITSCVKGFGAGDSGQSCAKEAISGEAVSQCVKNFGAGDTGLKCAKSTKSKSAIAQCVKSFGAGDSGLNCALNATSGAIVATCVSQFGAGDTGLNCATGR